MHLLKKNDLLAVAKIAMIIFIFSSCVPIRKQIYLQQAESEAAKESYVVDNMPKYTLQPGNNLYIRVFSPEEGASEYFNFGMGSSNSSVYQDASIYLSSYSVNDSGIVELPFIGGLYVKDMTLEEAKETIQKKVNEYLRNTMIVIKLVNYTITVVGEVQRPSQFKIYQDRINIYEVLGMAGDMTTFAKRDEVILVRKTDKGSTVHKLNLLSNEMLESEYFYIMPDDIIYVQPVKGKNYAFNAFPYTLVISSISLAIGLFALLK